MALIECRECGQKISDTATVCPNCGFTAATTPKPNPAGQAAKEFAVLACVAIGLIVFSSVNNLLLFAWIGWFLLFVGVAAVLARLAIGK